MKLLVFAHRLQIGGTQTNAIEIAAGLRDYHDFDVTLFATPGPLEQLVRQKGLRYIPAPDSYRHPSLSRSWALADLVRREKPDLVHVWDWWQMLDAFYAVHLGMRVPMVVSDMMMTLTRILPRHLPTTFGMPELVEQARRAGRNRAGLLLPPVDVEANAPGAVETREFSRRFELDSSDAFTFVTVSRLAASLKGESLVRSIEAVRRLGQDRPLRLVIVGDGELREDLAHRAAQVNAELGRQAIILTGALLDPRPAYALADAVIGMGGSALRGLASAKPVIVVGEGGFADLFDRTTAERFFQRGLYGLGQGIRDEGRLEQCMRRLTDGSENLSEIGDLGRHFVVDRFSLQAICAQFAAFCRDAVNRPPSLSEALADGVRTSVVYLGERRFLAPSRDRHPRDEVADSVQR